MKTQRKQLTARFKPYYRVQQFDAVSCVWRPIRGMHKTELAARNAALTLEKTRIEMVTETGRRFV